jgi:hypothetical protein
MPRILETDAFALARGIDAMDEVQRPQALDILARYKRQQDDNGEPEWPSQAQAEQEKKDRLRGMFNDLKTVDAIAPSLAAILPYSDNPDADRARVANTAYLASRYGKTADEINASLDLYRNDYATRFLQAPKGLDDLAFYASAAKELQRVKQKEDTEAEGQKAALLGDDVIPALQAWQAKNLDRLPDSTEYTRGFLQAREVIAGVGLSDAVDAYQRTMQGLPKDGDKETLKDFEGLLLDLPGAKRKAVLTAATMMAQARGEKAVKGIGARESGPMGGAGAAINAITGFFQEIGESGGRYVGKFGGIAKDEELESMSNMPTLPLITDAAKARHPIASGVAYTSMEKIDSAEKAADFIKEWKVTTFGTVASDVTRADVDEASQTAKQYRELDADEKKLIEAAQKREFKKNQIARELRSIAESSDPVGEISGAIGSTVAMAAVNVLTRGKTLPISWQLYSEANYDQLRLENPSLEPSEARLISRVSGAGEAALDAFEINILRKLPSVAAVLKSGTSAAWRNAGARLGATFVFEQAQEGVQDLTMPFTRAVFEAVGIDTGLDMASEWERWKNSRGTVAIASIPLILLGAGIATHRDIKDAQNLLSSRDRLGEQGIIEVKAVPILEAARAGKMDEAQALYREAFTHRSPEVAAEYQDKLDTQQKAVAEAVVEVTRQGLIPEYTLLPGGKVVVTDLNDGSKATFDSWRDAQPVIEQNMNEMERINNDSILRIADDILQKGEEVTVSPRPSDSLATRVRGGSMSPEDAIKAAIAANVIQGVNIDEARKIAADVFGESQEERIKIMRDAVERAIILGSNVVEGGVSKSKLFKSANLTTLIEETSEGRLKEGLRLGRYKKSDWLGLIQQAEEATGEKFLIGSTSDAVNASPDFAPRALVEAVSRIVVADVLGRLQDGRRIGSGSITKSLEENNSPLVAWVRAFKRLLASVLQTAKRIREARKTGKLGDEYDAYIDDLLGVDQQAKFEREASADAEAIANEALNVGGATYSEEAPGPNGETFSMSRAVPADASKIVQMPDGARLVGPTTFSVRAYHGTPYQVDRFRMAKIGTGEGAQAYGWGLYFAQEKAVAAEYQKRLGATAWKLIAEYPSVSAEAAYKAKGTLGYKGNKLEAKREIRSELRDGIISQEVADEAIYLIDTAEGGGGNLYTVELLPDEADFLDWDKPLSEQSDKVKAAIELILAKTKSSRFTFENNTGAKFYESLSTDDPAAFLSRKSAPSASQYLASLGIPGIRYLDGGSRGAGEGTSNYVIFDESLVKILEENEKPVDGPTFSISAATNLAESKRNDPLMQRKINKWKKSREEMGKALEEADDDFFNVFWPELMKAAGQRLKPSLRNINEAARRSVDDILGWLKENPKYLNYYADDWNTTRNILDITFPNFTNDDFVGFRLFTGLTSPATPLRGNLADAMQVMNLWQSEKSFGKLELERSEKGNRKVKDGNPFKLQSNTGANKIFTLKVIEGLFKKLGNWEAVNFYLHEGITSKELHAFNKEMGYAGGVSDIGDIRRVVNEATGQDKLIPRMFIFGPKVGAYTLNATGDSRFTTTDIWESRFIRSYFPQMFENGTGLPTNGMEHEIFQNFASAFKRTIEVKMGQDFEPSALQAVRWFYMIFKSREAGYKYGSTSGTISDYAQLAAKQYLGIDFDDNRSGGRGDVGNGSGAAGAGANVEGPTFSIRAVSPAMDAEYMAAVEAGDVAKQQAMVDAAAEKAGYKTKAYHKTWESFNEFIQGGNLQETRQWLGKNGNTRTLIGKSGKGFFFSLDKENTPAYHNQKKTGEKILNVYLKYRNPLVFDKDTKEWAIEVFGDGNKEFPRILTNEAYDFVKGDYDSIEIYNKGFAHESKADEVIVLDPNQIKSADPVTRDDQGNVIPLSQRFNPADNRITFSIRSGDFESRMSAAFSPFRRNPELRLAIAQVAKARAQKLGAEWIEKAAVIRGAGDIGKEARMREALAYEARMNDYMDGLTPNARQTLEFEPLALEDDPLVSAMLDFGKLMSFTNAKKAGKVDAKAGDYDGVPWLPPSFYSKGAGIMPDQMAQAMNDAGLLPDAYADTLWNELGKRIASTKKDKTAHREAVAAYKAAQKYAKDASRAEADQWAEGAKKKAGSPKAQRENLKAALRLLDGILAAAPPEVRARVGGYVKLAGLATDEAMLDEIERRIEKLNAELEKWLKKEGVAEIEKLFKKARPDSEAGKRGKGKDADMHALFAAAERAAKMDEVAVAGELARLDSLIGGDTLTPEQEALAITERGIVELVGDLKNADAGRVFSALDTLRDIYEGGWIKWKLAQIEKREERAGMRAAFIADTGKSGVKPERDAAEREAETLLGKIKGGFLSLSSFHEVLSYAFGSTSARVKSLVDAEREASGQYEDVNQALADEVQNLFTTLAGGKVLAGEKLRYDMAQRTIQTAKGELSQLGAIQALLMWRQEDGRRHMEGQLGEDGKPISSWSYDQAWIDEITGQLTPEAQSVMAWIMQKYGAEHAVLNPLYRQRYGVNMPAHDNYAPITVQPVQAKAGEVIDPVSGASMSSGSILTPGSLRTRSRNAIAEPEFRDALQTLLMHTRQLEYWKAYYDLALESSAILGNREVLNAVKAKGGEQAATALRKWIDAIAQGGFRDASSSLEMNKMLQRMTGRAASVGLLGRFSTLLVQSTQLAAASVKMPLGSYLVGISKLLTGNLGYRDAINSPFIQRRYKSAPPIVRQAMEGLAAASRPNQIKRATRALGQLLSGTDALFTAGTYALLLDYHRGTGRALGLTGADLEEHAHTEAQRDTEQVAQPTRMAARSLAEVTSTNPLAKVSWAYASEARQKIALMAWAATKAKSEPAQFAKTAFLVFGVGGLLKGLWREAKGDDDEKKWSAERLTLAALTGPLHGVPLASELMGDQGMLSGVAWAWPALKDIASGEGDMRDVDTLLSTLGLINDTAAAAASLSHAGLDAAKVIQNLGDKK